MTGVKICGLTRPDDIAAVNQVKPDYIGFVFFPGSKRYISPSAAEELKKQLSPDIKAVGVFVNEDAKQVKKLLKKGIIDIAQLHGQEDELYIRKLKAAGNKPVVKAVSVQSEDDILVWEQSEADYLLLDNGAGGTGEQFDWSLIPSISKPWFLAGGLHEGNIDEALGRGAHALDISSGVETDGMKDPVKIRNLVSRIRAFEN